MIENNNGVDVMFHYGALAEPLEVQANKQGFTFGDKTDYIERLNDSVTMCYIGNLFTDSIYNKVLTRFNNYVFENLKPVSKFVS